MKEVVLFSLENDAQSYAVNPRSTLILRDDSVSFSFLAALNYNGEVSERSILSIEDIGDELGTNYEIILPLDGESPSKLLILDLTRKIEKLRILRFKNRNVGFQKRMMQASSTGSYVVLFDPSVTYDIEFADLLHTFAARRDEVVLLSDLIVIPSVIFKRVGTWRDLRGAEDFDMLARIVNVTGIVVYNPMERAISIPSNEPVVLVTDRIPGSLKKLYSLIMTQRDQIIGSSYRLKDIVLFLKMDRKIRLGRMLLLFLSYAISRIKGEKPFVSEDSNYTIVMDRILESLILADYRRYEWLVESPRVRISERELQYLRSRGKVWGRISDDIDNYVSRS